MKKYDKERYPDQRNNDKGNRDERYRDERNNDEGYRDIKRRKKPVSIAVTAVIFSLLICTMLVYICCYSVTNKEKLLNNSYNKRQSVLLTQNTRGQIYSADNEVLAETKTDQSGNEIRIYPFSNEFAHIVGYASHGRAGIEALANYYLINSDISIQKKAEYDASGSKYPGNNVYTTLNPALQEVAYKSLGAYNGAVVVSDPKTGKILAMVSKPDYNPNSIDAEWNNYLSDKDNTVLLNRATQGLYPPGSTFKIITALEYIRENPDTYSSYNFNCNGSFTYGADTIKCFHGEKHGSVDFYRSFAKSCNSSFANIGLSLDKNDFHDTLQDLMFNSNLPIQLNYSKSNAICEKTTSSSDIMQLAIGQGTTAMSPEHLNMITCAIANGGTLMKPYVVSSVANADGKVIKSFEPEKSKTLMTQNESAVLTDMMKKVVSEGTAKRLKSDSYDAAGKTGSAEYSNSSSDSHAWFTGFAPADDPQICVTIIIEKAGSGGEYAVPIAKRIFDQYFGV